MESVTVSKDTPRLLRRVETNMQSVEVLEAWRRESGEKQWIPEVPEVGLSAAAVGGGRLRFGVDK